MAISKAKKNRELPILEPEYADDEKRINKEVYKIFILSDVFYQLIFDSCAEMQKYGSDLNINTKYRLNKLIRDMNSTRISAERFGRDLGAMNDKEIDMFFNISHSIYEKVNDECEKELTY